MPEPFKLDNGMVGMLNDVERRRASNDATLNRAMSALLTTHRMELGSISKVRDILFKRLAKMMGNDIVKLNKENKTIRIDRISDEECVALVIDQPKKEEKKTNAGPNPDATS